MSLRTQVKQARSLVDERKKQKQLDDALKSRDKVLSNDDSVKNHIYLGNKEINSHDYQDLKVANDFLKDVLRGKAMSEGTDTAGGYAVPTEFNNQLIRAQRYVEGLYQDVMTVPIATDSMDFQLDNGTVTVAKISENTDITTSDAVLRRSTLTLYKYAGITEQSNELLSDQRLNPTITNWLIEQFAVALGQNKDKNLVGGDGVGDPQGLNALRAINTDNTPQKLAAKIPAILLGTKGSAFSDWSPANVRKAIRGLAAGYRQSGRLGWIMTSATLDAIAGFADDKDYHFLQFTRNSDPQLRGRFTLMGYPVYETDQIAVNTTAPAIATNNKASYLYFGDLDSLILGNSTDARRVDTDSSGKYFSKDQTALRVIERTGNIVGQLKGWVTVYWDHS